MSKMLNRVNWFEIPTKDLAKSKAFYESILGVKLDEQEMGPNRMAWFPMDPEAPGASGTLMQGEGFTPSHDGTLVYFNVEDIDATLAKVEASGGKTLMPQMSIGEHGAIAHFEDVAGNRVALHQRP